MSLPPPELCSQLAFEPSKVRERGWVLLFNTFLHTTMVSMDAQESTLTRGLQWNVWLILEDSSILFEPSEITIQALLLVAGHGQDIATPSFCWTLVSHACHMSQTLALHLPARWAPLGSVENNHRNCLFWSLFVVDKAVAISFGRPPLLPWYLYRNVPPPNDSYMAKYKPHEDTTSDVLTSSTWQVSGDYGIFHFRIVRELSIVQGQISDLIRSEGAQLQVKSAEIKNRLDKWMESVIAVSKKAPSPPFGARQPNTRSHYSPSSTSLTSQHSTPRLKLAYSS